MGVKAAPDGYTLHIPGSGSMAIAPAMYKSLSYDPIKDIAPIALIGRVPFVLIVDPSLPIKSIPELIKYAKEHKLNYASGGPGSPHHLYAEVFKRMTGIEMTHVPYRGVALALNDVIPGRVDVMFNTMAGVLQQVRTGQLRGLAVTSAQRFPTAPDLPTVAESVPGFDVASWYALFAPAKTPADILRKLHADAVAVLSEPATKDKLEKTGVLVASSTPEELAARLKAETELWGPVIKAAGIKPQG